MDSDADEHDIPADFDVAINNIDRQLVSLRIGNEVDADGEPINAYTYQPSHVVSRMHQAPRGRGHTNSLASILAEAPNGGNDYLGGLRLFAGAFIITPFVLWLLVIVSVKLRHIYVSRKESITSKELTTPKTLTEEDPNSKTPSPTSKDEKKKIPITSWIAGGQVIDMYKLSRAGVSRKDRKRLVIRSWKIQSTFLSVSIFIPVLTVVLVECGWKPLEVTMQEIQELNTDVENLAYRGRDAVDRLQLAKLEIFTENELIRSIIDHSQMNQNEPGQRLWEGHDYRGFVDHNSGNRRAQFFNLAKTTIAPTDFFFPWGNSDSMTPPPETTSDTNDSGIFVIGEEENTQTSPAVQGFLDSSSSSSEPGGVFTEEWCPDAIRLMKPEEFNYWVESMDYLTEKTQRVYQIFDALEGSFLPAESSYSSLSDPVSQETTSPFEFITDATDYVDEMIDWYLANDWILKMLILVLNVVNGLLLANVYFLSKNNIIHQPTRLYVAYILIPIFVVSAALLVAVTVAAGLAVLINSDFCSGGSEVAGPQGTIEEAISTIQMQQQLNGEAPNEALGLVYDAIDYYWKGCLSENPLEFLEDFSEEIDDAAARVNEFTTMFESADFDMLTNGASSPLSVLDKACQRDMSFLAPSIYDLKRQVGQIRTSVHKLSDTMSCAQVSPLFRRVSHGAVCVDSPQGLAALWGSAFGISVLCFILLTTRAALYNSVKYKKRRPKKPRRIVEKEFDEYKEFMGKYYGEENTKKWEIDGVPTPPTKLELEFDEDIELKGTFETAESSKDAGDDKSDGSENAGIFVRKIGEEDSSFGSSYDSECSDDEKSIDSEDDLKSAIGSILSETKSIALQTIHSLRNVKSLLSSSKSTKNPPSHIGNPTTLTLGNPSNLDDSDEEDYGNEVFFGKKSEKISNVEAKVSETESVANSISDDSLYLPTPTSQSAKNLKTPSHTAKKQSKKLQSLSTDDGFVDEDDDDDENDEAALLGHHSRAMARRLRTPTNPISALSPMAPRKPLSFLARTLYSGGKGKRGSNYTEEELTSLVQPKQLANLNSFHHPPKRRGQEPEGHRHDNRTERATRRQHFRFN